MDDEPSTVRARLQWGGVCIDCADAEELARFYCEVFWVETPTR